MPNAEPLWRWLECRTGRSAVMAEWRDRANGSLSALQPLLTPLDRPAKAYPNPRGGSPLRVVHHQDGTIVGVDGDDWRNRLPLQRDDVIIHQLDLRRLRSSLCNTLSCVNIAKTAIEQRALCLQLGNWEPKKAASFPVYLLMCSNRQVLRSQVLDLKNRNRRPGAILLTPSRVNWSDDAEAVAQAGKMLLVPLCEIVSTDDGALAETDAWEEYLQAFAQMVKLTLPSNYRNKKPPARRAELAAKVEKFKKALVAHIRSARDGVVANMDAGNGAKIVKFLTKSDLARLAELEPYHVTRCFTADPQLKRLYEIANDPEELLRYGK